MALIYIIKATTKGKVNSGIHCQNFNELAQYLYIHITILDKKAYNLPPSLWCWPSFYLYDIGPDLDTANLGNGLGPVLPEVELSTCFTLQLEL
jgi:hypothetical protein